MDFPNKQRINLQFISLIWRRRRKRKDREEDEDEDENEKEGKALRKKWIRMREEEMDKVLKNDYLRVKLRWIKL